MDHQQYQSQQERRSRDNAPSGGGPTSRKCPNCGTVCEPGDAYCSECGEALGSADQGGAQAAQQTMQQQATKTQQQQTSASGRTCRHCGKTINNTYELCPHCGRPINDDHCTFCGTPYEDNEQFCAECGSPRAGIQCSQCGTLSFRSFCCHCNAPLNDNALAAIAKAMNDPKAKRAQQLAKEMEELEEYLHAFQAEIEAAIAEEEMEADGPDAPGLSAEGQQLQDKYAELLKLMGKAAAPRSNPAPAQKPSVKRREQLKKKYYNADKIMEAYRQKSAEMQATLESMLPDAGTTPQIQRDYYSARKVAIDSITQQRVPMYWTCKLCGFQHNQPSECAKPELGGVWTYQTITVRDRVWKYAE